MTGSRRYLGWLAVAFAMVIASCASAPPDGPPSELAEPFDETALTLQGDEQQVELSVYVADTAPLRRQGLKGWESLPEGTGMVFIFEEEADGGFWMKDTLIPLSIAFADADGRVHTVLDMEPCQSDPCPNYTPDEPYRYALEVEQGAFEGMGLEPGWRLEVEHSTLDGGADRQFSVGSTIQREVRALEYATAI